MEILFFAVNAVQTLIEVRFRLNEYLKVFSCVWCEIDNHTILLCRAVLFNLCDGTH